MKSLLARITKTARMWGLGLFVTLATLPTASATSLIPLDLAELTARADQIVVGTVESQQTQFVSHGERIITEVRIRINHTLRGAASGSVLVVRHLGGVVGNIGQLVFGEASFQTGEEVLLFAEQRAGSLYPVGMAQGALHVDTRSRTVHADLGGAELLARASASGLLAVQGHSLAEVVQQIDALMQQKEGH
jgi:hypothetical protein